MKTSKRLFRWSLFLFILLVSFAMIVFFFFESMSRDRWPFKGPILIACFLGGVALPYIFVTLAPGEEE